MSSQEATGTLLSLVTLYLTLISLRNLTKNLANMKQWNAGRKMHVSTLAVKSCIKFRLAGQRYKDGLISAARRARELESKGISWELSPEEIAKRESVYNENHREGHGPAVTLSSSG
jgi:hypothetical protein